MKSNMSLNPCRIGPGGPFGAGGGRGGAGGALGLADMAKWVFVAMIPTIMRLVRTLKREVIGIVMVFFFVMYCVGFFLGLNLKSWISCVCE